MKSQVIDIEHSFDSLCDFGIDAAAVDKNSRVNKVRLPFDFAAAEARQNTVRVHQADAGLRQADAVSVPKSRLTTNEIRIIEDRIEPVCLIVGRILVALSEEKRSAKAQIIMIDGGLDGCHVRADVHRPPRDRILIVPAKDVVITIGQIQPAEVTVAVHSEISNLKRMWSDVANQRRTHQKAVPIEFATAAIVVVERAGLDRITLLDE